MISTRRSWPKLLLGAALLLTLLTGGALTVKGQPTIPMVCWGVAYVDGEPAEDGTPVEAKIGGMVVASGYTYTEGGERGQYVLAIEGEWGDMVHFFVLGIEAEESPRSWRPGWYHLDLHVRKARLLTTITSPVEGQTYSTEQEFAVSAEVENTGLEAATSVTATIGISPTDRALLVWPANPEQSLGTIEGESKKEVIWRLQCASPGPTDISVAPSGWRAETGLPIPESHLISATVTVTQEEKAHLEVTDMRSDLTADTASTEQTFRITATVHNAGVAVAENVSATLSVSGGTGDAEVVSGPHPPSVRSLAGCESQDLTWEVQCTGPGSVRLLATPWGIDENTDEPVPAGNVVTGTITITQEKKAHLVAKISSPLEGEIFSTGQEFVVTATVSNTGEAEALGVSAVLSVTGGAQLTDPATAIQDVGTLAGGAGSVVSWTLVCTNREVAATIIVTPAGTDENTGEAIPPLNVESARVVVNPHPRLVVGVTAPQMAAVDTTFDVWATVSNTGEADAISVTLTLSVTGGASLVEGAERTIGDLDAGATSDPVTWTLRCDRVESAVVEVRPEGIEVRTGRAISEVNLVSDEATVLQRVAIWLPLILKNHAP